MSLIPHTFFPRSMFDWMPSTTSLLNQFAPMQSLMPSMMDFFDPFEDLDRMMSPNMQWINQPVGLLPPIESLLPKAPQRHRITIDCQGFNPQSIKTDIAETNGQRNLIVTGCEESGAPDSQDFSKREFKRTYALPRNAQHDKLVSYMAPSGQLIVDVPLMQQEGSALTSFLPRVVDTSDGGQGVQLQLQLPTNVDPSKIQVTVRGHDLIVKVEDKSETPDSYSRVHIYNKTRLPENTDFNQLKCTQENNQLNICAPINPSLSGAAHNKRIPVQSGSGMGSGNERIQQQQQQSIKQQQQQQQQQQ